MVLHMKPLLLGQSLAAKKAVKMKAYVSPTMGDVKERKAGFKRRCLCTFQKSVQMANHGQWNGKLSTKLSFVEELKYLRWYLAANNKPRHKELKMADSMC
ncbi:hypothetical protein SLA2020_058070 [Shorea laevis]